MPSIIDKTHDMLKSEEHTREILIFQLRTKRQVCRVAEKDNDTSK